MSEATVLGHNAAGQVIKRQLYLRVVLLTASALVICTAIIIRSTSWAQGSLLADFSSLIDLAVDSFLPYMISAVVAAMTAVAVITILPTARSVDPAERVLQRIKDLENGDLAGRLTVKGDGQLREIAGELNQAIGALGHQVASLKVINRQQWNTLCEIREAVERGNSTAALQYVDEMERNWAKIAEIEKRLST
jgi:methyl-accepting chemotaxis protein